MKPPKAYILESVNGEPVRTRTSYDPFAYEARAAKERIIALSGSGEAVTISVIENVNAKTFETDGRGKIRMRG